MKCNSFEKPVLESTSSLELLLVLNSCLNKKPFSCLYRGSNVMLYLLFLESCLPETGLKTALVVNQV